MEFLTTYNTYTAQIFYKNAIVFPCYLCIENRKFIIINLRHIYYFKKEY